MPRTELRTNEGAIGALYRFTATGDKRMSARHADSRYNSRVSPNGSNPLAASIPHCLGRDRHHLRQKLRRVEQLARDGKPFDVLLKRLGEEIAHSKGARDRRVAALPKPSYPQELPVVQKKDEIAAAIRANQVIVLCGETGSGKTTQLPKICLELGRGVDGMIGHTQPRRIAARSVAQRIAQEVDSPLGHVVGYKVRFSDKLSERHLREADDRRHPAGRDARATDSSMPTTRSSSTRRMSVD